MAILMTLATLAILQVQQALSASTPTASTGYVPPANGICTDFNITESITFADPTWVPPILQDNFDVSQLLLNVSYKDGNNSFVPFSGTRNVTRNYTVAATICTPRQPVAGRNTTVLVATHGVGFDSRYWTSAYEPDNYNFAQAALAAGYTIFYYDRIGLGRSQRISGYENFVGNQVLMLQRMIRNIRNKAYTPTLTPRKIVVVGHSLGSGITNDLLAQFPTIADAAVITGLSYASPSDRPSIAQKPYNLIAWSSRLSPWNATTSPGYLQFGDNFNLITTFFRMPYSLGAATFAASIDQPFGVGEVFTFAQPLMNTTAFKGPVLLAVGQYDFLMCGGDCAPTLQKGTARQNWSGSSNYTEYLVPGAGHGIIFGQSTKTYFNTIVDFLQRNV